MEAREPEKSSSAKPSKRKAIEAWLAAELPERITREHWQLLRQEHAPISESYLRTLLRDSGVALDPLVDGVHQDSFDALEQSLRSLAEIYVDAKAKADRETASFARKLVLSAKDHARWAAERAKDLKKQAEKAEMAEWLLVWLENPPVFSEWVKVRRVAMAEATEAPQIPLE